MSQPIQFSIFLAADLLASRRSRIQRLRCPHCRIPTRCSQSCAKRQDLSDRAAKEQSRATQLLLQIGALRYLSHEPDKIETAALVGMAVAHFTNNHRRNPQHRGWGWASRFLNCAQLRPRRVPISALEFGGREDLNLRPPGSSARGSFQFPKSLIANSSWPVKSDLEPSNYTPDAYLTNTAID